MSIASGQITMTGAGATERFRCAEDAVAAARAFSRLNPDELVKVWGGANLLAQFHAGVGTTAVDCAHLLETPRRHRRRGGLTRAGKRR